MKEFMLASPFLFTGIVFALIYMVIFITSEITSIFRKIPQDKAWWK